MMIEVENLMKIPVRADYIFLPSVAWCCGQKQPRLRHGAVDTKTGEGR
jgi:hypothetical protein